MTFNELMKQVEIILMKDIGYISDGYIKANRVSFGPNNLNQVVISFGAMYETPEVGFAKLKELSKLLQTDKISLNPISSPGCDTCDFGSDYCNEIHINDSPVLMSMTDFVEYDEKVVNPYDSKTYPSIN